MTPRQGLYFYHKRILDTVLFDGKSPQLCKVTKIANGTVYYRPVYDLGEIRGERLHLGNPGCFRIEDAERWMQDPATR